MAYLKLTTTSHGSVLFSDTQPGGETGVGSWATHDVLGGVVRFDDDGGSLEGEIGVNGAPWTQLIADHGDLQIKDVRVTGGASGAVGDGAQVQVDDLTINNEVIDFSENLREAGTARSALPIPGPRRTSTVGVRRAFGDGRTAERGHPTAAGSFTPMRRSRSSARLRAQDVARR